VAGPGGAQWHVRRRWAPRALRREGPWARFKRRQRQTREGVGDLADPGCAFDVGEGIVAALAILAIVLVLIFLVIPALVALGELLFLVLLALLGVVGRVLFRRPWTVDATGPGGVHHEWQVVGWRASGEARDHVARHLAATGAPPTDVD
jgi:hypothetical protein